MASEEPVGTSTPATHGRAPAGAGKEESEPAPLPTFAQRRVATSPAAESGGNLLMRPDRRCWPGERRRDANPQASAAGGDVPTRAARDRRAGVLLSGGLRDPRDGAAAPRGASSDAEDAVLGSPVQER